LLSFSLLYFDEIMSEKISQSCRAPKKKTQGKSSDGTKAPPPKKHHAKKFGGNLPVCGTEAGGEKILYSSQTRV